jgi:hypothetical protein
MYYCNAHFDNITCDTSNELDFYNNTMDTIDTNIIINENLLYKTNKYNKLCEIKYDLLKYINNETKQLDSLLTIETEADMDIRNNILCHINENTSSSSSSSSIKENISSIDENVSSIKENTSSSIDKQELSIEKSISPILKEMITTINKFKQEFTIKQDNLLNIEKKFIKEIKKNRHDVNVINELINKTGDLTMSYIEEGSDEDILIDKMIELSKTIKDNSKIYSIKDKYVKARIDMVEYIEVTKYLNNFNTGNTCSICLSNKVDKYYVPCGHTCCKKCAERSLSLSNSFATHSYNKCEFCRTTIEQYNNLYYN